MLQAEDVGVGLLTKPGNAVEGQKCSASEQKGVATVSAEGVQQRIFFFQQNAKRLWKTVHHDSQPGPVQALSEHRST